jgi:hypothetical protein
MGAGRLQNREPARPAKRVPEVAKHLGYCISGEKRKFTDYRVLMLFRMLHINMRLLEIIRICEFMSLIGI